MNAPTQVLANMAELHRFLFCSPHGGHGQWLSAALRQSGVVLQEAGRPSQLQQRIAELDPQLVLLDFSGAASGDIPAEEADVADGGIACAADLARALARAAPKLPVVAVGSTAHPAGTIAALRAGVHEFIDMNGSQADAFEVVQRVLARAIGEPAGAAQIERHGRFVVLLGVRAGVGASTLSVHLAQLMQERYAPPKDGRGKAAAASRNDTHVALLDLGLPAGDGLLYLNTQSNFHFADAVRNLRRLDETLVHTAMARHPGGLVILPLPHDLGAMRGVALADAMALTDRLRHYFDLMIADLGGFSNLAFVANLARAADEVWLVADQSVGALVSLAGLLHELEDKDVGKNHLQLVLNRYDPHYGMDAKQIAKRFGLPLAATLPDRALPILSAANQGKLTLDTARNDPYVRALQPLAARLAAPAAATGLGAAAGWLGRIMGKH